MTKGNREEAEFRQELQFLKQIDARLAGESLDATGLDDELRATVEFAAKLVDLHDGPTPEFSQRLKSKLLIKLTEQEETARLRRERGWFWQLWSSPLWRGAAVSLVAVVAIVSVLWQSGLFTGTVGLNEPAVETADFGLETQEMAPRAAVEIAADTGAAATEAAPMATAPPAPLVMDEAGPQAMSSAEDTPLLGDFSVELHRGQWWTLDIDIEVTLPASASFDNNGGVGDDMGQGNNDVGVVAWYGFDDGPLLELTAASSRYIADEKLLSFSWPNLEPAPSDAITLILTIQSIGDLEGPWVYEIPLRE